MSAWNKRSETFCRLTVLTWQGKSCSGQKSTGFVSIVYSLGSNLPAASMFGEMGGSFCFVMGNAMIHAKRSLTSGLINHFFSSLSFQGILFSFHHILSLSFSFFSSPSLPPSALLVICWHFGMPHHPYHSSLLICSLICLDGRRKGGLRMKVTKVWRENRKEGGKGGGSKKEKLRSGKSSLIKSVCMPFNS